MTFYISKSQNVTFKLTSIPYLCSVMILVMSTKKTKDRTETLHRAQRFLLAILSACRWSNMNNSHSCLIKLPEASAFFVCLCLLMLLVLRSCPAVQVYGWLLILSWILLCLQLHADEPFWRTQAKWRRGATNWAG